MTLNPRPSSPVLWLLFALVSLFGFPLAAVSETLTLTKNGPKTAREGDLIEYRLEALNQGSVSVDGAEVFDTLPAEVTFVGAVSTPGGVYEPATGIWTLPSLGAGEDDRAAELRIQALVSNNLLTDPGDVALVVNEARVVTPQTPEPVEAAAATNIVCPFCIDWEILSVTVTDDARVDLDRDNTELRFDLHVQVTNNGPVASEGTVTAIDFSVLQGDFHPTLILAPTLPVPVALAPGETQVVTFGTNWSDWPDTDYKIAWEFEVADTALMDPVMPNTLAGFFGAEGYDRDSGGSSGCFIATAAYGSYLDPHVRSLRDFRDEVLMQYRPGRVLVTWYYEVSPPVAQYLEEHQALRTFTRMALTPLVFAIDAPGVAFSVFVVLLCLTLGLGRCIRVTRDH